MVEPAFGQVRIRVEACGVCHTDALAPRGQLIVAGAGGNEPIEVDPVPLLFGMRSIAGTMTGSSTDAEDTLSFSSLQGIRPMIETYLESRILSAGLDNMSRIALN
jgi:D-arabinose 1-dehydrogenase-like Zn-dependent alcohol dehydrogenase